MIKDALNRKEVIFGIGFLAGGAISGIASYLFLKKRFDKKLDEFIEKENAMLAKGGSGVSVKGENQDPDVAADDGDFSEIEKLYEKKKAAEDAAHSGSGSVNNSTDYAALYSDPAELESPKEEDLPDPNSYSVGSDRELAEADKRDAMIASGELVTDENRDYIAGEEASYEMRVGQKPKLITSDSYYNDYLHFDKVCLDYYTENDVLVDTEANEEIQDEMRVVGTCLDKYDFRHNDDESIIYVRNMSFGTDYEISKVYGMWDGEPHLM